MSAQELERTGSMHFLQVFTAGLGEASERHANMWQQHQAPADDAMGGAAVTSAEPGRLDPGLCSAVAWRPEVRRRLAPRIPSNSILMSSLPTGLRSTSPSRRDCHPTSASSTSAKRAKARASKVEEEQEDLLCPLCGGKGRNGPTR